MKRVLLIIFFLTLALMSQSGGPTPDVYVGSDNILDGSITNAKMADDSIGADELIDDSVGVDAIATGYNLLTDAEKTQALTGSSTVDFSCQKLNGIYGVAVVTLDAGDSVAINTLFNSATNSYYGQIKVTCLSSAGGVIDFWAAGSAAPVIMSEYPSGLGAVTDTASKICVFFSGTYTLKNNQAGTRIFIVERL